MNERITLALTSESLPTVMRSYFHYVYWANITLIDWMRTKFSQLQKIKATSSFMATELTLSHRCEIPVFNLDVIKIDDKDKFGEEPTNMTPILSELMEFLHENSLAISNFINHQVQNSFIQLIPIWNLGVENNEPYYYFFIKVVNCNTYLKEQRIRFGQKLACTNAPLRPYNDHLFN